MEAFAPQRIQTWFQRLLEEEVEELLGRARCARRDGIDAPPGYRNGPGKPRRLTLSAGTIITNPVESPLAAVRLRTATAKRYKKVENATAVIWKTLLIAE